MSKPNITDWIKTAAVVFGVGFAFYEFRLASDISKRQKIEQVGTLINAANSERVLDSATSLLIYSYESPTNNTSKKIEILRAMTPYHEHLSTWAFCYDSNLCDQHLTKEYTCKRLIAYERTTKKIFENFKILYGGENRPLQKTQLWADCKATAS